MVFCQRTVQLWFRAVAIPTVFVVLPFCLSADDYRFITGRTMRMVFGDGADNFRCIAAVAMFVPFFHIFADLAGNDTTVTMNVMFQCVTQQFTGSIAAFTVDVRFCGKRAKQWIDVAVFHMHMIFSQGAFQCVTCCITCGIMGMAFVFFNCAKKLTLLLCTAAIRMYMENFRFCFSGDVTRIIMYMYTAFG